MAPPRPHGASDNPTNRFERLSYLEDPEYAELCHADPEEAAAPVAVRYYDDPSRTLLATNRSPDVPFDVSLNPYRGCLHGCIYCLTPDTPVLHADMGWRPIGEVRVGDELLGFDEYPEPRCTRKLRSARVEAVWWSRLILQSKIVGRPRSGSPPRPLCLSWASHSCLDNESATSPVRVSSRK